MRTPRFSSHFFWTSSWDQTNQLFSFSISCAIIASLYTSKASWTISFLNSEADDNFNYPKTRLTLARILFVTCLRQSFVWFSIEIIIGILSEALKGNFLCPPFVNEDQDKPLFVKFSCPSGLESLLSLQPILNASTVLCCSFAKFLGPRPLSIHWQNLPTGASPSRCNFSLFLVTLSFAGGESDVSDPVVVRA